MDAAFRPVAPRPAPQRTRGLAFWLRSNLFGSTASALITLALLAALLATLPAVVDWLVFQAVWQPDFNACQAARGRGACWGVIAEKHRVILFGRYPLAEQWRAALATLALLALLVASAARPFWRPWLAALWVAVLAAVFVLLGGGIGGLAPVPTDRWGGLPLTLLLTTLAIVCACPIAVAVALGRRSGLPAIRTLCTTYVEAVRGVPLISVLFMASFMFPLFMPAGISIDVLLRVGVGLTLFAAAYLAEIVRGGLQAIPRGQIEAAEALGLTWWQAQRRIVLPQALATVVPGIMNSFISLLKDTSLVTIVSLYELTGAMGLALNGDADWRPFKIEAYLFIAAIYFALCFAMSRYSLWVERQLGRAANR
jgi:general L-amino acid transport system permease protein